MNYRKLTALSFSILFVVFFTSSCAVKSHQIPKESNKQTTLVKTETVEKKNNPEISHAPIKKDISGIKDVEEKPVETNTVKDNDNETIHLSKGERLMQSTLDTALELVETARELWNSGETDKALENLDEAYLLITKIEPDNDSKFFQQKEDVRFMISKRIMEIYASRFITTNGTHREIPLVMNDRIEREIQIFQTVERNFFLESYARSGLYRKSILEALKTAGLPEEISWLPLIESGFKVKALSRARALGLWQFIPSTGYKFGLKRNDWIDERLNPQKATLAAIAYLKELHKIFGDWATALAAYNCGEGNVLRAIRGQKINYLDNFWDLYERLPQETARYYPRFLAVLHILKDPEKYGFNIEKPNKPIPFETITIEKPIQLKVLADNISCEIDELLQLNPELRYEATPSTAYELNIPMGKKEILVANLDNIPKYTPPPALKFVYHNVRRGDTLSGIAIRYGTTIQRIVDANRLTSRRTIRVGRKLKIPRRTNA